MNPNDIIPNTESDAPISQLRQLLGHESEETAFVSKDYPWGFRMRTEQRYWIESRKNKGQRFVYQTKNPKTGRWCTPKKSTYFQVVVMVIDEKEHVNYRVSNLHDSIEKIEAFAAKYELNDFQKKELETSRNFNKVMTKAYAPVRIKENNLTT